MIATLISFALFALPALAGTFTIETPKNITSCAPATFKWSGGKAPYDLVIVASEAPCGDILADLGGGLKGTSMTWPKATVPASFIGKTLSLSLEDADGDEAWSGSIEYVGADTSCLTTTTPGTTTVPSTPQNPATPSGGAVAAGAANVGNNPLSGGALTSRQTSSSVFVASAVAALVAFSL